MIWNEIPKPNEEDERKISKTQILSIQFGEIFLKFLPENDEIAQIFLVH